MMAQSRDGVTLRLLLEIGARGTVGAQHAAAPSRRGLRPALKRAKLRQVTFTLSDTRSRRL